MQTMILSLPLPPKECSPNWRGHWAAKARAVKTYRHTAACTALSLIRLPAPNWERAAVQATFHFRDARRRDKDNLLAALKPAFDGLADAGIIANDSGLTHLPVIVKKNGHAGVTLAVTPQEETT